MSLEIELIEKLKDGNEKAFDDIFNTYYTPLCIYAKKYVEEIENAEEIVQDLFVKLWEKQNQLDINTSLKSYLYKSTYNSCLDFQKHLKIQQKYKDRVKEDPPEFIDFCDNLIELELEEKIKKAIDSLPKQCCKIFKLSRFENLKYKEIAEQLNISVKTVENQMGKALKILKEKIII